MNIVEKAKEIVATFLKVKPSEVDDNTVIDASGIQSSVLILRMHAALANEGIHVRKLQEIRTFGDLLRFLDAPAQSHDIQSEEKGLTSRVVPRRLNNQDNQKPEEGFLIGIDIEDNENMPKVDNYREDNFYTQNFSKKEISYCILQPDPLKSFAGKFSAKEAIVKADNSYAKTPFNEIEILNDENRKPFFENFVVSISHAKNQAVAIAVRPIDRSQTLQEQTKENTVDSISREEISKMIHDELLSQAAKSSKTNKIIVMAIVISMIAIGLILWVKYFNV